MKIGIDGRLINETGVGRYIRCLIRELGVSDTENNYIVFLPKKTYDSFLLPNSRWEKRMTDAPWHSITEQIVMPWLLMKERLDLVHIPYFNVPIFYPGEFIVTIHDLTILHFDTGKASTLPYAFYKLRRIGYFIALSVGLLRAKTIIAVSQSTKQEIIDHFHVHPEKIVVTYEGVDEQVKSPFGEAQGKRKSNVKRELPLRKVPYFLYVGNAYPHKNLEMLLAAFQEFLVKSPASSGKVKLVLVGKDNYFYQRVRRSVRELGIGDSVIFFGEADEKDLSILYGRAVALVFPSLMEGFGLPLLEALGSGCRVICSDIPVFHEIAGDAVSYFPPHDPHVLMTVLADFYKRYGNDPTDQMKYREEMAGLISGFNWNTMATQTLEVYMKR